MSTTGRPAPWSNAASTSYSFYGRTDRQHRVVVGSRKRCEFLDRIATQADLGQFQFEPSLSRSRGAHLRHLLSFGIPAALKLSCAILHILEEPADLACRQVSPEDRGRGVLGKLVSHAH